VRNLATILLTVVYMLVGGLHVFCDSDVTTGSAAGMIVSVSDADAAGDVHVPGKSTVGDHHCHGCFAVSVPAQVVIARPVEMASALVARPYVHRVDATLRHDTPPPKFLS
jgi:hypothetical protein